MYKTLEFENFRGVEHCKLENLTDLNILVGQNGADKTACLEAALIHACGHGTNVINFVVRHRVDTSNTEPKSLLGTGSLFGNRAKPAIIRADKETSKLYPTGNENTVNLEKDSGTHGTGSGQQQVFLTHSVQTFFDANDVCFVDADRGHVDKLEDAVTFAEENGYRPQLVQLLQQFIPNATDVRIIVPQGRPTLFIEEKGPEKTFTWPAAVAGDGIKRLLGLAARVACKPRKLVLIEDPDAFLHAKGISQLARMLLKLSKSSTQVVLTTHNVDLIRLLLEEPGVDRERIRAFLLTRTGGTVNAKAFNGNQLPTAIEKIRSELGFHV